MTLDLETRVRGFVRQHPGLTAQEIAKGVRARHTSVLDVLAGEEFSGQERGSYASDRAVVYRLVPRAGERQGRAARRSQCSLIAAVLADGQWHSTASIHQRCGFSRLNSRIAELRSSRGRWGMHIDARRLPDVENGPDAYQYRLVGFKPGFGPQAGTSSDAEAGAALPAASVSPGVSVPSHGHDGLLSGAASETPDSQLEIGEAA